MSVCLCEVFYYGDCGVVCGGRGLDFCGEISIDMSNFVYDGV